MSTEPLIGQSTIDVMACWLRACGQAPSIQDCKDWMQWKIQTILRDRYLIQILNHYPVEFDYWRIDQVFTDEYPEFEESFLKQYIAPFLSFRHFPSNTWIHYKESSLFIFNAQKSYPQIKRE